MPSFTSIKNIFRRKKNKDRVYVYDEDHVNEVSYKLPWFLRFYAAMGCIVVPRPTKYYPEFDDVFIDNSIPARTESTVLVGSNNNMSDQDFFSPDFEDDLELIDISQDIEPNKDEGEQFEGWRGPLIGFRYKEEEGGADWWSLFHTWDDSWDF